MSLATGFGEECDVLTVSGRRKFAELVANDCLVGLGSAVVARISSITPRRQNRRGDPRFNLPVLIAEGAFRPGVPSRDIVVAPNTLLVLSVDAGRAMVSPVRDFVNGGTLQHLQASDGVLYTVACRPVALIDVQGVVFVSALAATDPDLHEISDPKTILSFWRRAGLDLVYADETRLQDIRTKILLRAEQMGWERISIPDLTIEAAQTGTIVSGSPDGTYRFTLPPGPGRFEIHGPSGMAFEVIPDSPDHRSLCAAVTGMTVDGLAVGLESPTFASGFFLAEPADHPQWRWMSGIASTRLPPSQEARAICLNTLVADWTRTPKFVRKLEPRISHEIAVPAFEPHRASAFIRDFAHRLGQAHAVEDLAALRREALAVVETLDAERNTFALHALSELVFKYLSLEPDLLGEANFALAKGGRRLCHDLHVASARVFQRLRGELKTRIVDAWIESAIPALVLNREIPVLFVFMTKAYLPNFKIWLALFAKLKGLTVNLVVFTFEIEIADAARALTVQQGVSATICNTGLQELLDDPGDDFDRGLLWYVKVKLIAAFVGDGFDAVYSDLDCYWVGDVAVLWGSRKFRESDICFMSSSDMPIVGVEAWHFVPCAGFVRVAATPAAAGFVQRWLAETATLRDDQISVSEMLLAAETEWRSSTDRIVAQEATLRVAGGLDAKIAVLSDRIASRKREANVADAEGRYLWHPRWIIDPESHRPLLDGVIGSPP